MPLPAGNWVFHHANAQTGPARTPYNPAHYVSLGNNYFMMLEYDTDEQLVTLVHYVDDDTVNFSPMVSLANPAGAVSNVGIGICADYGSHQVVVARAISLIPEGRYGIYLWAITWDDNLNISVAAPVLITVTTPSSTKSFYPISDSYIASHGNGKFSVVYHEYTYTNLADTSANTVVEWIQGFTQTGLSISQGGRANPTVPPGVGYNYNGYPAPNFGPEIRLHPDVHCVGDQIAWMDVAANFIVNNHALLRVPHGSNWSEWTEPLAGGSDTGGEGWFNARNEVTNEQIVSQGHIAKRPNASTTFVHAKWQTDLATFSVNPVAIKRTGVGLNHSQLKSIVYERRLPFFVRITFSGTTWSVVLVEWLENNTYTSGVIASCAGGAGTVEPYMSQVMGQPTLENTEDATGKILVIGRNLTNWQWNVVRYQPNVPYPPAETPPLRQEQRDDSLGGGGGPRAFGKSNAATSFQESIRAAGRAAGSYL